MLNKVFLGSDACFYFDLMQGIQLKKIVLQHHDGFLRTGANSLQPYKPICQTINNCGPNVKICTQERANYLA